MALRTDRFELRPWQLADAPALWQLMRDNRKQFTRSFAKMLAADLRSIAKPV